MAKKMCSAVIVPSIPQRRKSVPLCVSCSVKTDVLQDMLVYVIHTFWFSQFEQSYYM